MKLLILTPSIPFPLTEGGKVAQYSIIDAIRSSVSIVLVLIATNNDDKYHIDTLKAKWPDVDIRMIDQRSAQQGKTVKHYLRSSLRRLKKAFSLIKGQQNTTESEDAKYTKELSFSTDMFSVKSHHFITGISTILEEVKPDIVQVDIINFLDLVYAIPSWCRTVFVHQEIRYARVETLFKTQSKINVYDKYIHTYIKDIELNVLDKYDGVIVYSDDDKNKLSKHLTHAKLLSNGFPVPNDAFKAINTQNLEINKLVFVGGDAHFPNVDAVEWYMSDIASEIWKRYNLCLHVVGKWTTERIQQYADNPAIHFAGFLDDLAEYCKNSIMLVPVRVGSGIRTKILFAMAQGTPIVTASVGCEGIIGKDGEDFLIANTQQEYVNTIGKLLADKEFTHNMVLKAQHIAEEHYSQNAAGRIRLNFLEEVLKRTK